LLALMTVGTLLAVLGGCGVRGGLDPPMEAKAEGTSKSPEAAASGPNSAAPQKPHQGFILDGLIR